MAASVTVQDVRHVAMLARLGLTDERANALTKDLNTILEHMGVLSRVDTKGVDEASGIGAAGMRLREDSGPAIPLELRRVNQPGLRVSKHRLAFGQPVSGTAHRRRRERAVQGCLWTKCLRDGLAELTAARFVHLLYRQTALRAVEFRSMQKIGR